MKSYKYLSTLALIIPFLTAGCIQSENDLSLNSENEVTIDSTSLSANIGESLTFNIPNENQYTSFSWKAVHESGLELSECASNQSSLSCAFDEAGKVVVSITTIDRNGAEKTGSVSIDIIDPSAPKNQAPRLVAEIKNSAGQLQKILAVDAALDNGSLTIVKGNYTIDLSKTSDDSDNIDDLTFEISFDGVNFSKIAKVSTLDLSQVQDYEFYLRATDLDKSSAIKKATATVTCDPLEAATPKLDLSSANITVAASAGGIRNFYDFSISNIKGGSGSANYQVSWDFNGDGIPDSEYSSSLKREKVYTFHAGSRKVKAMVQDTICKYSASKTINYNFNIYKANSDFAKAPATRASILAGLDSFLNENEAEYYFLQASVRPVGSGLAALEAIQNVEFRADHYLKDNSQPVRVFCDYRKDSVVNGDKNGSPTATFTVKAKNKYYRAGSQDQSLTLTIAGIDDLNGTAAASENSPADITTDRAYISALQYSTDGGQDIASVYNYVRAKACTLTTKVIPLKGTDPCNGDGGSTDYTVRILGVFNCPDAFTGSNHISLGNGNGAFYCEVENIDACIGAGPKKPGQPPQPK